MEAHTRTGAREFHFFVVRVTVSLISGTLGSLQPSPTQDGVGGCGGRGIVAG